MEPQLATTLTDNNGPTLGRLTKAYVNLALIAAGSDRSRSTTVDRYGTYEVRLVEFLGGGRASDCLFWLELYCHVAKSSVDSCRCDNFDDAEIAADDFISSAKQLRDKSE